MLCAVFNESECKLFTSIGGSFLTSRCHNTCLSLLVKTMTGALTCVLLGI